MYIFRSAFEIKFFLFSPCHPPISHIQGFLTFSRFGILYLLVGSFVWNSRHFGGCCGGSIPWEMSRRWYIWRAWLLLLATAFSIDQNSQRPFTVQIQL